MAANSEDEDEFEGRLIYDPHLSKDCKGELESEGILLPPLVVKSNPGRRISEWKKKVTIVGVTFVSVVVLVITGVFLDLSLHSDEPGSSSPENSFTSGAREMEKHTKLELNFQADLHRVYSKIIHENTPEELTTIFDYYKREITEVRDISDLREYSVLLRSEGMLKAPYNLTRDDVSYALRLTENFSAWYSYLNNLTNNLKVYETQKNMLTNKLEIVPKMSMDIHQTRELNEVLKHYTKPITTVLTDSLVVFKANVVMLSQVLELLQTDARLKKSEIFVFATDIIYLDADAILPQTSLAIIAPTWSFLKDVNIFIRGLNADKHRFDTASTGEQGLPGRRGGNGGLFIGAGNLNMDRLHIYSNGGNGGDGQNGSDGRNGSDTEPPDYKEPYPYSCRKHLQDIITKYGEVISYYTVYDSFGCGTNGTDGGSPGRGGSGGNMVMMDTEKGAITFESGDRGSDGIGGKGGKGGRGASAGFRFQVQRNGRGKIHPITSRAFRNFMPSGSDGRDSYNTDGEEDTRANFTFFTEALKHYRIFAMEEYENGNKKIWDFIRKLDDLPYHSNLSSTQDLVRELEMIDEFDDVEFYESIHNRIQKAWKYSNSKDLTYLRALSYGKLLNQKHRLDRYIIIDFDLFLETVLNDLQDTGGGLLDYKDHTLPILIRLLREKVDYLNDSLDRWIDKTMKLSQSFHVFPNVVSKKIHLRKMAYLTLTVAKVLEPGWLLEYSPKKMENCTFSDLDASLSFKTSNLRFSRHEEVVLRELKAICTGDGILKTHLKNLKNSMRILNDLVDGESELSDFPFDLEYFEITAEIAEIVEEKQNFKNYLSDVARLVSTNETVDEYREYLSQTLVISRYKDALNVFRQWVFPHMYSYDQFLPKNNLTVEVALSNINLLRKWIKEYKSTITSYDKYIREAVFSFKNSVGGYYRWHGNEIRSEIIELFKGRKIHLTSSVENEHIFTKSAIKFRAVRIELLLGNSRLSKLLKNVQVEMRHSGYSYYYYNGQVYMQNGEGFDLRYSYELDDKDEPINCNMVYKKLMNGPAIFSPYTTWTIQLKNIPDELLKLAPDDVDIALVGFGSYIDITD